MDVHFMIQGLSLFVHDPSGRWHVIFPATSSGSHQHFPTLEYNGHPKDSMNGKFIDFSRLGSASPQPFPIANVLEVGPLSGKTVPAGEVGPNPTQAVASRITLPHPDRIVFGPRVFWTLNGVRRQFTHRLEWVVTGVAPVTPVRETLRASTQPEILPVAVPDASGVVKIDITNLPQGDHPVCMGMQAAHTGMYYGYLQGSGPIPILDEPSPYPQCADDFDPEATEMDVNEGPTAYNCMLAQAMGG